MSNQEPNTITLTSQGNKSLRADVREEEGDFGLLFQVVPYRRYLFEGEERRSHRYNGEAELLELLDVIVQSLRYIKKRRTERRQQERIETE